MGEGYIESNFFVQIIMRLLVSVNTAKKNRQNMKRVFCIIALSVLILTVFATIGCSRATRIGDILANTSQYEGKNLTIKGTVGETTWFGVVGKGAYQPAAAPKRAINLSQREGPVGFQHSRTVIRHSAGRNAEGLVCSERRGGCLSFRNMCPTCLFSVIFYYPPNIWVAHPFI
jgi:hypothetical protein